MDIYRKRKGIMADYKELVPIVRKWEGGWSNKPNDRGGCTMSGVTIATFRSVYGNGKTCSDLRRLTEDQWNHIFKKKYWDRWRADEIRNQSIANLLVDWLWTSGVWGIKYPQRILGVTDDGLVGPRTIAAINGHPDQEELFRKLWNRRLEHFRAIAAEPGQHGFLKGWTNRLNSFRFSR